MSEQDMALYDEAVFLCERIREFEGALIEDAAAREFYGHVMPSVSRLEDILAKAAPQGNTQGKANG